MTVPFRGDPNWPQCSDLGPYQTWQLRLLRRARVGSGCQVGTGLVRPIGDRYTDLMVEPSIRCPQCGTTNPLQAQFCMRCGTALVQRCPTCGRANPSGAQFCLQCGAPLLGTGAAERRVVTVLFADLAGSTRGEVVADLLAAAAGQFMVTGEVVNFAARLQAQAPPDGIVMDNRTCEATRHAIAHEPLPPLEGEEFGGRPRFRVTGLTDKPPARRLQAEMIGRDEEMQFLTALYRRVVEGQHPHLVTVVAAAGIGKTRLVAEFLPVVENPAGQAQNPGRRPSRGGPGSQRRQRDAPQQ